MTFYVKYGIIPDITLLGGKAMKKNRKNRTKLGQKIYETRRKMKLSRIEFAQKIGLSEASVLRIENGNMAKFKISTLKKLSEAFPNVLVLEDLTKLAGYREEGEAVTLAQKVKNARLAKGWSRTDLAKKCAVIESTIYALESCRVKRPQIKLRRALKKYLGIDV